MRRKSLPALLALLLLLLPTAHRGAAFAQAAGAPPPKGETGAAEAARRELERKALGLLEEALAGAEGLKLAENRVRAQSTAARLLWPRDAKAGRAAFKAAADGVAALNASVDTEDPQFYSAAQTLTQLRSELVQVAGQFDPKLALEFLRATRPPFAEAFQSAGLGHPSQEQMLEMTLANQVAAEDPRLALEMAEESLAKAFTTGLLNVINLLRSKDPAAASKLAVQIVRKLRPEDLRGNYEASAIAQQLIFMTRTQENPAPHSTGPTIIVSGTYAPTTSTPPVGAPPLLDAQTRRELVEKVLAAVAGGAHSQGDHNLFQALQTLLPEVEKYAPGRAAALRRRAEEMEGGLNPRARLARPFQEVLQSGTAEAMLEAAPKAPAEVRDQLYMQAAWRVFNEGGDAERARQILENVSNPQRRVQARRSIEQQAQWRAAQQGNFAAARQMVARLHGVEEKVTALLQLAGQASAAGDRQTARQALEEARGLAEGHGRGQQQFSQRLQVAGLYAQVDADVSFEMVEAAIARLDELIEAAYVLDGFGHDSFREGELRAQGGYVWNELISQCAQTLGALAPADFERASAGAKKFRRAEARTTAQLLLAQHILSAMPTPATDFQTGPRRHVRSGGRE